MELHQEQCCVTASPAEDWPKGARSVLFIGAEVLQMENFNIE